MANGILNYIRSPQAKGLGIGLLSASGYQKTPQTLGQAIGKGLLIGQQLEDEQLAEEQARAQQEALQQYRQQQLGLQQQQLGLRQRAIAGEEMARQQQLQRGLLQQQREQAAQQLIGQQIAQGATPRQIAGLLAQSGNLSAATGLIKESLPPRPTTQINIGDKQLNKADIKKIERADINAEQTADALSRIQNFKRAVRDYGGTGILEPYKILAGQVGQSVGVDVVDPKALAAGEQIKSFGAEFLNQFIQGTKGAVSEKEVDIYRGASPGIDKTTKGNMRIANAMEAALQRKAQKSEFLRSYYDEKGSLTGAENAWNKFVRENPIIDKELNINRRNIENWGPYIYGNSSQGQKSKTQPAQATQSTTEPVTEKAARPSTPSAQKRYIYNPETGRLE